MDIPAGTLQRFTTPVPGAPRNERQEIISKFLDRLNAARSAQGFGAMKYPRLAKVFEKVPTADLYPFYRTCDTAKSFSAMFWYLLKPKKKEV